MYQWDKLSSQEQHKLRNLQLAREEQWKQDIMDKTREAHTDHLQPFNDVVDEWSGYFAKWIHTALEDMMKDREGDNTRQRLPEWTFMLWNLGPDRISYIFVRSLMESTYTSAIYKDNDAMANSWALPKAQTVCRSFAENCWDVCRFLEAKEEEHEWYKKQSRFFKQWNTKRRKGFAEKVNALPKLTAKQKDTFAHAIFRMAREAKLLDVEMVQERLTKDELRAMSKRKRQRKSALYVMPSADLVQHLMTRIDEYMVQLLPNRLPMVCRPVDHIPGESGGLMDWSIRKMRKTAQVKARATDEMFTEQDVDPSCMSPQTRRVINTLQSSEWRINTRVLEVMDDLWKAGRQTGTIPAYDSSVLEEMPPYPEDGDGQEKSAWMLEKSVRWGEWSKGQASRLQMIIRSKEASKLRSFTLWHAYFCDFRGRYYSDSYLLHPQGGDLDKSLLMAAEPVTVQPRDIYWIKVNLSNLMGVDKVSFDDRAKYVDDHMDDWRAVVADPHGTTNVWEDDAPKKNASFQRLAAIFDLIMAIDEGKSQVPVQLDGACNGVQHWAALTRDEKVGPKVNLTPGTNPQDLYQFVADGCTEICIEEPNPWRIKFVEHYEGCIPRKVCKRSVMCDPYGISDHSVTKYVLGEGHMNWVDQGSRRTAGTEMGKLICQAKAVQMEHCAHGKEFVTLLAGWLGDTPLSWVTPSGFKVINKYVPSMVNQNQVRIWNKTFHLNFQYYVDGHDNKAAASAMPPNFVHSLDAAHMSLCVDDLASKGIEFFSMIHDSFGVMAPYVPMLRASIKETFYAIHSIDQLARLQDRAEIIMGEQLPAEHPAHSHSQRGDLDIRGVLESEYLFG